MENQNKLTPQQEYVKSHWVKLIGEENFKKLTLDEYGYSDKTCRGFLPREYGGIIDSYFEKPSGRSCYHRMLYRPKSLEGFEDNGGWSRVDVDRGVQDYPREDGLYHVEKDNTAGGVVYLVLKFNVENGFFHHLTNGAWVHERIFAWRKIEDPPKRLY